MIELKRESLFLPSPSMGSDPGPGLPAEPVVVELIEWDRDDEGPGSRSAPPAGGSVLAQTRNELAFLFGGEFDLEEVEWEQPPPMGGVRVLFCGGTEQAHRALATVAEVWGATEVVVVCPSAGPEDCAALRRAGASTVIAQDLDGSLPVPSLAAAIRWSAERCRLLGDLQRARELGQHLALHDGLTGLPNRMFFRTRLRQELALAKRHSRQFAVLFVDLDRFKQVNDSFGHAVGDQVLAEVARRLQSCVRETDFAARSGGDEFQLVLADIRRGQDAARVARKICTVISKPLTVEGTVLYPSASIGISLYPADGEEEDTLVKHADAAMYQAKHGGRAGFRFYLPQMTDRALERLALESRLRSALDKQEFCLYYQPRVELETGRIRGVEALVRWQHPDLGLVYPDEFIPVAEETGLIVQLGEWVAYEACRQFADWRSRGIELDSMAINVSARQFELGQVGGMVRDALEQSDLDPEHLEIEITESAVMENPGRAIDTLRELRDLGVGIAVDDFGTGHSSLAYLKNFPITKLKIDKAFVRPLPSDGRDLAIVQAIIHMAHSLSLTACAEGVETEEVLDLLREPGCDEVQGYVFSPPVAPDRLEALL